MVAQILAIIIIFALIVVLIKDFIFRKKPSSVIEKKGSAKSNKYANWALILGILCLFFATTVIVPVLATTLGYLGTQEATKVEGSGKGKSLAGLILGIVYIAVAFYTLARY